MAQYYWQHIYSPQDLTHYQLPDVLQARATELLSSGLPIEIGDLWYGGKHNYKLRYTERVDYPMTDQERSGLYINQDTRGFWVMCGSGSVHSVAFLTRETAEAYMQLRQTEVK